MKREEKSVIQRFLVVLMVVMLLVTPSQGEADSSSTGSRSKSDVSRQEKSTPEGYSCLEVGISGSALKLPIGVRLGILQHLLNGVSADLFYKLIKPLIITGNEVSFLVNSDGLPIKAFSGSSCENNAGRGDSQSTEATATEKTKF